MTFLNRSTFVLLMVLGITWGCFAQKPVISGKVIDKNTKRPVIEASVSLGPIRVSTDYKGDFTIWTTIHHPDTLKVNSLTHESEEVLLVPGTDLSSLLIELRPKSVVLDDVKILGSRGYNTDSVFTREQFEKIFNYDAPKVIEAFSLTSINVSMLFEALSKEKKLKVNLQKRLRKDEEYKLSQHRYNKRMVEQVTKLEGEELDDFYFNHQPTIDFILEANDYDLIQYIKKQYDEYKKSKALP